MKLQMELQGTVKSVLELLVQNLFSVKRSPQLVTQLLKMYKNVPQISTFLSPSFEKKASFHLRDQIVCRVRLSLCFNTNLTCRPFSLSLVSIDKKHVKGKLFLIRKKEAKFNFVDFLFIAQHSLMNSFNFDCQFHHIFCPFRVIKEDYMRRSNSRTCSNENIFYSPFNFHIITEMFFFYIILAFSDKKVLNHLAFYCIRNGDYDVI